MNTANTNQRLDYLDALRAFALLLGIVFHASMSFTPMFIGWAVMDVSTSPLIGSFLLVSHSFRMELFFLIAGYFSHMTLRRKGTGGLLQSRITRIGLPFVIGWFILKPLIVASWAMGNESLRGDVNILHGFKVGFQSFGELPSGLFTGTHLWFLYYLLLVTGSALGVRTLLSLFPNFESEVKSRADSVATWVTQSRCSWFALSVPTGVCLWFMNIWGVDTPDRSLFPNWAVLILYGGCFSLGWLIERQPVLLNSLAKVSIARVVICLVAIAGSIKLSSYQGDLSHPQIELIRSGFCLTYPLMMWSLISLSIGVFQRTVTGPNRIVRYLADSSYWLYLIHLPIVVWFQIAFAELEMHWSLKLVAISLLTITISIALYDLLVRSTFVGQLLNGQQRERVIFRSAKKRKNPHSVVTTEVLG